MMFQGIHAVLYALFQADEQIDAGAMRAQVAYCLEQGCDGITLLGLATEVLKLTPQERWHMVETVGPEVAGTVPFSVTVAGNSVAEQSQMARIAKENGADWLILQPPVVGTYDARVYLDFFERVAASTDLPVAVQNAPQYLGRGLSSDDIAQLRTRCPNLAAIKAEDPAAGLGHLIKMSGGSLSVLGGRGGLEMIDCLRAGAQGFVLAPDIAPVAHRIFEHWAAGREQQAAELFAQATPAINFTMQSLEHLIAYGKRIFAGQAGLVVHDRAPALDIDASQEAAAARFATDLKRLAADPPR